MTKEQLVVQIECTNIKNIEISTNVTNRKAYRVSYGRSSCAWKYEVKEDIRT
ncbi:hypothetical protein MICAH_1810025 [Microcystis aeruginosa PCC 9809]|uniref:Uncharacterized protein n=1 Tax=Microcystis aeruginosa PCC 9809 TaxID=1160285 RepID=I4HK99_MICAE|nr:hypothetical protein MICAH_1810025 [Microcystis aeruginosa PCC 9809]